MLICAFPPHYQLVYISFDISSFSVISYAVKQPLSQRKNAVVASQENNLYKTKAIPMQGQSL